MSARIIALGPARCPLGRAHRTRELAAWIALDVRRGWRPAPADARELRDLLAYYAGRPGAWVEPCGHCAGCRAEARAEARERQARRTGGRR